MLYLAANHARVPRLRAAGYPLGWIMSPAGWRRPDRRAVPYAIDNGRFRPLGKLPAGALTLPAFWRLCEKAAAQPSPPLFAVLPDQPYAADATRALADRYAAQLSAAWPFRWALAVQDGMTPADLDRWPIGAVFVAGSTAWKWRTVAAWAREAKARGLYVHVARVNTIHRIRHCIDVDADSADGTGVFRGNRRQLAGVLDGLTEQRLFS